LPSCRQVCSATAKQLLHRHADIARDLPQQRWRNVATTMEGHSRPAPIGVPVLAMRPTLPDFDETQPLKQRDPLAWLEDWKRARHYAT